VEETYDDEKADGIFGPSHGPNLVRTAGSFKQVLDQPVHRAVVPDKTSGRSLILSRSSNQHKGCHAVVERMEEDR
jgi:hypothetical protein